MFALSFAVAATAHTSFSLDISGKASLSSYKGAADIQGTVDLIFDGTMVEVQHNLTNLEEVQCGEAKNACGMHIHKGTTCDDLQGHFWINSTSITEDPWAVISYKREAVHNSSTSKGASASFDVGYNATQAAGHAFVLHDANGTPAACAVIPQLEKSVAPRFSHADDKHAVIGVTGEVTIIMSPSTTTRVRFNSSVDRLIVEKTTYVSVSATFIAGIPVSIAKEPVTSTGNAVWSLLFGPDFDGKSTKLTVEIAARDCRAATSTTTTTGGTAATTTATTTTAHAATTTSTTTGHAATTSLTSSMTTTTTVPVGEPLRRVEGYEIDTSTAESVQSMESVQTTDDEQGEEDEVCNAGFVCHETMKSCQARTILPAGSAGTKGNNSNAVQSSSCAILVAMITYFLM